MIYQTDINLTVSQTPIEDHVYERPELRYSIDEGAHYIWVSVGRFKAKKQKVLVDFKFTYYTTKRFTSTEDMDAYAMKIEQLTADTLRLYDGMYCDDILK